MKKKRLLIFGITMDCAGTQRALLSFLPTIDREEWEITLLLARHKGLLMKELPGDLTLLPPLPFGELFLLSRKNAPRLLFSLMKRHRAALPAILRGLKKGLRETKKASHLANRVWIELMKRLCPDLNEHYRLPPFDLALSFWGDRTMFYLCEKAHARRHITWLHFEFDHPPREERLYRYYFAKCRRILCVDPSCTAQLRRLFPSLSRRILTFENPLSRERILHLSALPPKESALPTDQPYLLTVSRICHQKGSDRIPAVLAELKKRGVGIKWLLIGEGEKGFVSALLSSARALGVSDSLICLGARENPYPYFVGCQIFVLPSRYEGKPITVEEAKLLGCPIVVCDYLSAGDQLKRGDLGIIVGQDRIGDLANAICSLLRSPNLSKRNQNVRPVSLSEQKRIDAQRTQALLSGRM